MQVFKFENVFLGTASRKYIKEAIKEIKKVDKKAKVIDRFPDGVFTFCVSIKREAFLTALTGGPPIFLRHIHPVDFVMFVKNDESPPEKVESLVEKLEGRFKPGNGVAVQARRIPGEYDYTLFSFKKKIDRVLKGNFNANPTVKNPQQTISIFAADSTSLEPGKDTVCSNGEKSPSLESWSSVVFLGVSTPKENLCEWAGGIVRFAREKTQVSRAEFKLLEALEVFPVGIKKGWNALDLGSSPGGWARILVQKGCRVTAVDQAPLDPSVSHLPGVRFVKKNAFYYRGDPDTYDLLTNDVNRDPIHSARAAVNVSSSLKNGASLIMTLKLPGNNPRKMIEKTLETLYKAYEIECVRQLFHNRDEVTIFGRRK